MADSLDNTESFQGDFQYVSPEKLTPGTLLGKEKNYKLEKFLGAGEMGHVWLAAEMGVGGEHRKVICKILPKLLQQEKAEMKKVQNTFQLVLSLSHPNICPIYALKTDPVYGIFLVMGYADSGTLEDWVHARPGSSSGLPLLQVLAVLRPLASALDHAHDIGIVHRDVKPQKIHFVTFGNRKIPWLIDFGVSAQIHSAIHPLGDRSRSGISAYTAPEQCQNMEQDGRTDQYALGVMAYQLLSGCLPFVEDDPVNLRKQIVYTPAPPLTHANTAVNKVVLRALSKERKDRYASCMEFMNALEAAAKMGTKRSSAPSLQTYGRQVIEMLKKHSWPWVASLIALLVVGFCFWGFLGEKPQKEPGVTRLPASSSEPSAASNLTPAMKSGEQSAKPKQNDVVKPLSAGTRMVLTVDEIEYAFRWCPPGEFMMGSRKSSDDEKPAHKVKLTKGFWMLETEVTQEMWRSVMDENPSDFRGTKNPVERVSWEDAKEFCQKLSQKLDQQVQLPTEAQWEYACRAGTTGDFAGDLDSMAWYFSNSDSKTHMVGQKKPNDWGLYDMHGNVIEWCLDYYDEEYYGSSPTTNPENGMGSSKCVDRGGAWNSSAQSCRSADRSWGSTNYRGSNVGFRFCLFIQQKNKAGQRKVLTADGIEYAFRWCPPGEFMMGGNRYPEEQPIHKVNLTQGFWLLETEVTQEMWQDVMGDNPSDFKGDEKPVDRVSWNDCQNFCRKLGEKLGQKVQLPTEAQWEYACRAGTTDDFAGNLDEMGWHKANADLKTHAVGLKKPNAWGLYDMHGNVCEYCQDWFGAYSASPVSDPTGPLSGSRRVARGGNWDASDANFCRSQYRWGDSPDYKVNSRGLRIILAPCKMTIFEEKTLSEPSEEPSAKPESDAGEKDIPEGTRKVLTADGIEYAFRWCPPGEFMMGGDRISVEMALHEVKLTKGFWLLETEVTQEMWQSIMGSNPSTFKGSKNPVDHVNWNDSQKFCEILSQKLGKTIQLPTESQWEYACRAGSKGDYAGNLDEMGWYKNNSDSRTHSVGLKKPNAWGLYDMHGNVYEWCFDYFGTYPTSSTTDPTGPSTGYSRTYRGGYWNDEAIFCRSANRGWDPPGGQNKPWGLRVLLVPDDAQEPGEKMLSSTSDKPSATSQTGNLENSVPAGARKVLDVSGVEFAFRWCPPGEFVMGGDKFPWEKPAHKVKLTEGFWILETEVTQEMWKIVTGRAPSHFKGDKNPVEQVSWNDCQMFCLDLGQILGQTIQLPTEAQWEYACRAGTTGDYAGDVTSMAWFHSNSDSKTHPAGQKQSNAWGLCDMYGNVAEWCSDCYDEQYYAQSPNSDPSGPQKGSCLVNRGGSWFSEKGFCRSANRSWGGPEDRRDFLGLRIVLIPNPQNPILKSSIAETNTLPASLSGESSSTPKPGSGDSAASAVNDSDFEMEGTGISKYKGNATHLVIPSVINGQKVTSIKSNAFRECRSLQSVVIPEGVTSIGWWSFWDCRSLTSVVIPDSLQEIGNMAFANCLSLKQWSISSTHPCFKSVGIALLTKDGSKLIACPTASEEYRIPEGVTVIGGSAFAGCKDLTSVVIPDCVNEIEDGAFARCPALKKWSVSSAHPYIKCDGPGLLTKRGKKIIACLKDTKEYRIPEGVTEIGGMAFFGCEHLTSIVISESVSVIGESAFNNCRSLKSAIIPEGVTKIDWSTFMGCSSLTSVVIPKSVTMISSQAFLDCFSLKSATIPEGVKGIGWNSFRECRSLTSAVIPGGVTQIGASAFWGCTSLTSLTITEGVKVIGSYSFRDCTSLTTVIIPEGVTKIEKFGFTDCTSLTALVIPQSVTDIEEDAFSQCPNLTIYTPAGSKVEEYALKNNIPVKDIQEWNPIQKPENKQALQNLISKSTPTRRGSFEWNGNKIKKFIGNETDVVIPGDTTEIGFQAFEDCASIKSVIIPEGVTTIGVLAFYGCRSLTFVVIPDSVTEIKDSAFDKCPNLTIYATEGTKTEKFAKDNNIPFNVWRKQESTPKRPKEEQTSQNADFRSSSTSRDSFEWDGTKIVKFIGKETEVVIPNGVTKIGENAFRDCSSLKTVTIPKGVTEIERNAFRGCSSLKYVVIPDSVKVFGKNGFRDCTKLIIRASKGSKAEEYAEENEIPFEMN